MGIIRGQTINKCDCCGESAEATDYAKDWKVYSLSEQTPNPTLQERNGIKTKPLSSYKNISGLFCHTCSINEIMVYLSGKLS